VKTILPDSGYSRAPLRISPAQEHVEINFGRLPSEDPYINLRQFKVSISKAIMSYIPVSKESHFSIKNIPFGIFSSANDPTPRPATRIGDFVLDLSILAREGAFSGIQGFNPSSLQQVFFIEEILFNCSLHSMISQALDARQFRRFVPP
jgi:Fumarylacetoacetase N-terminal